MNGLFTNSQIVRPEQTAQRAAPNRVHRSRLKVNEHRSGHILPSSRLIVIDVDSFKLEIACAFVGSVCLDAVFFGDNLPVGRDKE